ncbi:16S rRNA (adenine(1518)-N(6)/adenine(1519)-N(6))-dimethyltransferase RsmA [Emticicia sp. TH156]|uniref:16S rRNA (adenine(1518)-N(6)/adenine(1519)-N(6))- dimethyltransferase RsmA n=1 Tax=Emticicia sp. TH156 TaxID=2067454 RepID=UPI000C76C355|nr:16S rRNA (adenine(1518)-N(6)/adenine(1519)-N(6))-dimethyltransferase RsmA [Emticicia sp. TH156]PLK43147.1 16S rRNA (adenine(1518)-N(6)/adenine(1519)-N(6))-dimethyltransferase [Emticicia sp. TH156]
MQKVKPKKHLGQHFLKDLNAAERIVNLLALHKGYTKVLEIGPGMGVLTQFLLKNTAYQTSVVEIDRESVEYLKTNYPELSDRIFSEDFLRMNLSELKGFERSETFGIIGNFPYNISSQIFFKVLEHKDTVAEVVCMLQKEVAKRIASPPGNKDYGILSVLLQAYYDIKYEFTVLPGAFNPPPKVDSGVISLKRNAVDKLDCDERKFFQVVKAGFNQRRKTLRNALKPIGLNFEHELLNKRAEQLGVAEFILLTKAFTEN